MNGNATELTERAQRFLTLAAAKLDQGIFSVEDVDTLLGSRGRISSLVLTECLQKKLVEPYGDKYRLVQVQTRTGQVQDLRLNQLPPTRRTPRAQESNEGVALASREAAVQTSNFVKKRSLLDQDSKILLGTRGSALSERESIQESLSPTGSSNLRRLETRERTMASKLEIAKARAKAVLEDPGESAPVVDDEYRKVQEMALAYEEALSLYANNPTLRYLKGPVPAGTRTYGMWARAVAIADEIQVDYSTYVKAQFWCFDKWYSRAPKLAEMCSRKSETPAAERVRLFLTQASAGEINSERAVRGRVRPAPKVSDAAKCAHSERQLRQLMKNFNATEEEILLRFGVGNQAYLYFDKNWLASNPTYQKLKAAGRI